MDPSLLGATATFGVEQATVLTLWRVESFGSRAEIGLYLVPVAVDRDGKRVPTVEKQYRDCLQAPTGKPLLKVNERHTLLRDHIEPTLQRELDYRGIASPEKGYSTELLAWVEVA